MSDMTFIANQLEIQSLRTIIREQTKEVDRLTAERWTALGIVSADAAAPLNKALTALFADPNNWQLCEEVGA